MSTQTVKQFVTDSYRLVTSNNPGVQLRDGDMADGIRYFNELLYYYSAQALVTTIATLVSYELPPYTSFISFGDPGFIVPTDDPHPELAGLPVTIAKGRLSNLQNSWVSLYGVDYPMFEVQRAQFFSSYKYQPLSGLPRYVVVTNQDDYTTMQIYPKPSQVYTLWLYGKFELATLDENSVVNIPNYSLRFYKLALGKDLCNYKARGSAWTPKLQSDYKEAKDVMESASTVDLSIDAGNDDSMLNGANRVRAGV